MQKKRGQVWVETVIYTLIAFTMIGAVLAIAKPKIEEIQDKTIIDQSILLVEDIDNIILSIVQGGQGNKRLIEPTIKEGNLRIDGINNKIVFEIESRYVYSQPGKEVYVGGIIAYTEKKGKYNTVTLTKDYSGKYNITYDGSDEIKSLNKASIPYKIFILNKGKTGNETVIDITLG